MEKLNKIKKNIVFSLFAQVITIVLGLIVPRISIVNYGSEINGLLVSASQILVYLNLFESGIQAVASQALYKPVGKQEHDKINEIIAAVNKSYYKTGSLYSVSLLSVSLIYSYYLQRPSLSFFTIFIVVFFSGFGNVLSFFFQGKYKILMTVEGKSYLITNINALTSVISILVKIIMMECRAPIGLIIFVTFILSLLPLGYIEFYIRKDYKWIDLNVKPNYRALSQNRQALIHQISTLVFSNTDVMILTIFCDLKIVSVYGMYRLIMSNINAILRVPLESVSFALGQMFNIDRDNFKRVIDMVEVYYSALTFSVYTVALFLIIPFMRIYTASVSDINYVDSNLALLFIVSELLNFSRNPMLNVISYAGHYKETVSRTIVESLLNLSVSILAVGYWGIYGVLLGTILALLYRTTDIILYSNIKLMKRSPRKTLSIYFVDTIIFVLLGCLLNCTNYSVNSFIEFLVVGTITTPVVLLIYLVILSFIYHKEAKLMQQYIKKFISRS